MKPTLDYVRNKIREYNTLCFGGELPEISVRLSESGSALGMFVHPRCRNPLRPTDTSQCCMKISVRFDLPENVVEDVIIHEMIHYYIWYKRIVDTAVHGEEFCRLMHGINMRHGRNITVRHKQTSEALASDVKIKRHYICVTEWRDGRQLLTVCASTRIFEIDRLYRGCSDVAGITWYWSLDPWFNRFPTSRTAKAYLVDLAELASHLSGAMRCVCEGGVFQPAPGGVESVP